KDDHYYLNCSFRIDQKKVIIAKQSLLEIQVNIPNKIQEVEPKKFLSITETEKKKWVMGYFSVDLERDIHLYYGGIKRNKDIRKYHKFLTDRKRLVGKELLCHGILKSGLSTAWLNNPMEE
ncbi:5187_t:CDS:1, partial [Diversispora eburnea]